MDNQSTADAILDVLADFELVDIFLLSYDAQTHVEHDGEVWTRWLAVLNDWYAVRATAENEAKGQEVKMDDIIATWSRQVIEEYQNNPDWSQNDLDIHIRLAIRGAIQDLAKPVIHYSDLVERIWDSVVALRRLADQSGKLDSPRAHALGDHLDSCAQTIEDAITGKLALPTQG